MSFPRYPTYKESGVEWLGQVPEHWGVGSARWLTRRYSGGTPDKTNLAFWEDGTIPWLNSGAVNDGLITEPSTYITVEAFANSSAKWIPEGALVMALAGQGKTKGMVAQLGIPSTCNQSMAAIIPGTAIDARFLYWWLGSNYQNIRNMAGGDLRDGLNLELLGNIQCPLPLRSEQTKISAFLDCETAKIDGLVAEQRRLMALLKEKRQAVISHAVTRGLNPDAPMKPSGIEWLGDVPAHWEVVTAKRVSSIFVPQRNKPELNSEGDGLFWVTMEQMRCEEIKSSDVWVAESAANAAGTRVLKGGAVIASCVGTFGLAAINKVDVIINQQLQAFIPTDRVDAEFLRHCVVIAEGYFLQIGTAATIAYVNQLGFANMPLTVPPKDEQHQIVAFLAIESAKFDTLTAEAQRAIDLLQERRTALISAAVTGQIDVRSITNTQHTESIA